MQFAAVELGPVDILVANAGVLDNAPLHQLDAARWQKTIDTNLTGVFNSIKAVLPSMLELGRGRIIAISSMAGRREYGHRRPHAGPVGDASATRPVDRASRRVRSGALPRVR
jgi:NADP-dependent 3-hydroxy acid dehydrogenase YdfG